MNTKPKTPPETRFWSKVDKKIDRCRPDGGCWEWTGAATGGPGPGRRYGIINETRDKQVYAHRLSWTMHFGPLRPTQQVLHHCDNTICVRPSHLFLGTQAANMADMVAKGRQAAGTRHASVRLTPSEVREIRASTDKQLDLAAKYGVSQPTISNIRRRVTWVTID